ncbi:MAG TPA: 2-phosphosulfolactate phosphatase [Pseudonocardiaceae bacterium]
MDVVYTQDGFDVRLEWGPEGVDALASACAVLVIVDVLSFSTAVDVAVGRGVRILPLPWRDERAAAAASAAGAILAGERSWTLRPSSLVDIPAGTFLALPSPNGATLCRRAADAGVRVLVGCLRNATAVATRAQAIGGPIGVIAAGERWSRDGRPLRPGLEDYLGAGTIVAAIHGTTSPEAAVAAEAARTVTDIAATLAECTSGRELIKWGHADDVELAGRLDVSGVAPELVDGVLTDAA